jgi:uncharacterized membrane protein
VGSGVGATVGAVVGVGVAVGLTLLSSVVGFSAGSVDVAFVKGREHPEVKITERIRRTTNNLRIIFIFSNLPNF